MKKLLLLPFLLFTIFINAQFTAIPDPNFEQALIDLGYDTGVPNGVVPTANISNITSLYVASKNISNLEGIEDFIALDTLNCSYNTISILDLSQNTSLTQLLCYSNDLLALNLLYNTSLSYLDCQDNSLSTLDLSQNLSLTYLDISYNLLTSLNVSPNLALTYLNCSYNSVATLDINQNVNVETLGCAGNLLPSLDVSQNINLQALHCGSNQLTNLDVSMNTVLRNLTCDSNLLTCLNLKNGNNINLSFIYALGNTNLTCIDVDDVNYSNSNWTSSFYHNFDLTSSFSNNCNNPCSTIGIDELSPIKLVLYPNPTREKLSIFLEEPKTGSLSIKNSIGQIVLQETFTNTNQIDINLNEPIGIYFLQLETDGEVITRKIIKQ